MTTILSILTLKGLITALYELACTFPIYFILGVIITIFTIVICVAIWKAPPTKGGIENFL